MVLYIELKSPERILNKGVHLGYKWIVSHNNRQHRCGYVRIPKGHPFYGIATCDTYDITVHGGITFSESDEDKFWWWIGFDCNHYSDAPDPDLPILSINKSRMRTNNNSSTPIIVEKGKQNVFEDLNFEPEVAINLKIRANLILYLQKYIKERGWTHEQAAKFFKETSSKINNLMDGDIEIFSIDRLVTMIYSLSRNTSSLAKLLSCIHSTEPHIHHINSKDSVIRTQAYVETECKSLCEQAFNASPSFFTQKDELYEF